MRHIYKCVKCGKYTMKETCDCGHKTMLARPVKYSSDDKFSSYRRKAKIDDYRNRGLL
ncbi:ribosome biogenesis protein [Candidatus Woesearchaeota archaeon]|nr:ribosome biogenesis protein [Candidatus Woesearchaeota archaeon]